MRGFSSEQACRAAARGFTLIELAVIMLLISVVAAISMPRLAPIIAFSQLEGAARHLAYYGRGAVARATMLREKITLRIDLENQEYYAVQWVIPKSAEELKKEREAPDQVALLEQYFGSDTLTPEDIQKAMEGGPIRAGDDGEELDTDAVNLALADKFDLFARRMTEERAKNVKHESFLDEVGPLFDKKLNLEEEEPVEEEMTEPEVRRTQMAPEVRIDSVLTGEGSKSSGVVEIELTPLGLQEDVTFYLVNEDGDYFTVTWQAASGATGFFEGRQGAA